jgi:hypothetical protein
MKEKRRLGVLENRVLRKMFRPNGDQIILDWRQLNNEELHVLYSSQNITRIIKSMRMRWTGQLKKKEEGA